MSVFDVDIKGLSQLIEDQGPARLIAELIRNSFDEDGTRNVAVTLAKVPGRPLAEIEVADDSPAGFAVLSHAYTLFTPSYKKAHADKAGRFNLGDKLFLAAAITAGGEATISSTTGTVIFSDTGRVRKRGGTEAGSVVSGRLKCNAAQYQEIENMIRAVIVPENVTLCLNGEVVPHRRPLKTFTAKLPTVVADGEGVLRDRVRETTVSVYEPAGEPHIYELGMPVVEINVAYDVDVGQKIKLNMNRDNVLPSYLRTIQTLTYNAMHDQVPAETASSPWVREATSDPRITPEAMKSALTGRFGEKRVTYDPSDPEANHRAVAEGYTVVSGRMLNADEWENNRRNELTLAAGKLFPTPKPYSDDPNAPPADVIPEEQWTDGMRRVAAFARRMHRLALGEMVRVSVVNTPNYFAACYARGVLDFNLRRLGHKFFDNFPDNREQVLHLLIHEFGHFDSPNHLSKDYHEGICRVGAKLVTAALSDKTPFKGD